jgi:hypothetical protein
MTLNLRSLQYYLRIWICGLPSVINWTQVECSCYQIQYLLVQCVPLEGSPRKCWFTSACHTCMKCGCRRRCWKCPPVCSVYTWLVTVESRSMGPIIRRCDNARSRALTLLVSHDGRCEVLACFHAQNTPTFWEWRGSSNSACGFSLPHKRVFWELYFLLSTCWRQPKVPRAM